MTSEAISRAELQAAQAARPGNLASLVNRRRIWVENCLLVAGGLAYAAAFPPLNLTVLGWIGLTPLLFLLWNRLPGAAWRGGFLWGYAWACSSFFWLREIEWFIPFLLGGVLALFPAFWALAIPVLKRGVLIPVAVQLGGSEHLAKYKPGVFRELFFIFGLALWWCVIEWIRAWIATGLPWNYIAVSQWRNIALIQICEFTGIHGLNFLMVFTNFALALAVRGWWESFRVGRYRRPVPLILAVALIMSLLAFGARRMLSIQPGKGDIYLSAAAIQADIPQMRVATEEQVEYALEEYLRLTELAVADYERRGEQVLGRYLADSSGEEIMIPPEELVFMAPLNLIIWPETALPLPYIPNYLRKEPEPVRRYSLAMFELIAKHQIPFLIGSLVYEMPPDSKNREDLMNFNSALLLDKKARISERYDKVHIVPFGEYVPFGDYLDWLRKSFGMGRDLSRGSRFNPLEVNPGVRAGVNICFEDVFPYVSRELTISGANLLVVLTNDAWYPESSEPVQHLAHAVFRAVENRRPVLRVGNNACSCLILPNGVISEALFYRDEKGRDGKLNRVPYPEKRGKAVGTFVIPVKEDPPLSFYTRYGDVFIYCCIAGCLLLGFWCLWCWREKREAQLAAFEDLD